MAECLSLLSISKSHLTQTLYLYSLISDYLWAQQPWNSVSQKFCFTHFSGNHFILETEPQQARREVGERINARLETFVLFHSSRDRDWNSYRTSCEISWPQMSALKICRINHVVPRYGGFDGRTRFKVMLHGTIRNDDFYRNTALQHCCNIVSNCYNIVPTLHLGYLWHHW